MKCKCENAECLGIMPFTKEERAKLKAERFRAEVGLGLADGNNSTAENVKQEADGSPEENSAGSLTPCCVPFGCTVAKMVNILDPDDVEKVVCNNADCMRGEYMHKSCFLTWEEEVLTYLRSSGRARSWSEKQRRQNLWTKKGYDLAWKACSCQCGKGHLRKDLDWIPPKRVVAESGEGNLRRQRRRKKSSDKPSIGKATTLPATNPHSGGGHGRHRHASASSNENHTPPHSPVVKTDFSVSSPSQSPYTCMNSLSSSIHQQGTLGNVNHQQHVRCKRHSEGNKPDSFEWPPPRQCNTCSEGGDGLKNISLNSSSGGLGLLPGQHHSQSHESIGQDKGNDQVGQDSNSPYLIQTENKGQRKIGAGYTMPFIHRVDLSVFVKLLPPQKCNPYHIRMDNEQGPDDDEVRVFVYSALASHGVASMICSMCQNHLPVFDCYPLIDGTFYLTPLNHSDLNLRLIVNGRVQYLGAVCMQCLEGVKHIVCRICHSRWDGSHHQLGTVYSYDIFAASPCCVGRVSCKKCGKPVTDPSRGTHFFSEYSQNIPCPHCGIPDFHFVKPLSSYEVLCQEIDTC
ncbi:headcase protein homolog [Acanthaster planci]|uniref:Headcase protein homolog n=1 Tax=Acanthaster planci TaxID=133434 RepID=A0A8B7XRF6_ACAPL|nr:headcase protein homolog [Acanthaster planci]